MVLGTKYAQNKSDRKKFVIEISTTVSNAIRTFLKKNFVLLNTKIMQNKIFIFFLTLSKMGIVVFQLNTFFSHESPCNILINILKFPGESQVLLRTDSKTDLGTSNYTFI